MNDKLMQAIRTVNPGRYGCTLADIVAIRDAGRGGPLDTGCVCFKYGFLRGQQAAKAEAKRKAEERRCREMKTEAPGYGLLLAMAKKNKGNVRFVSIVSSFMLKMDGCADKEETANE